jgi:hypothetical protein
VEMALDGMVRSREGYKTSGNLALDEKAICDITESLLVYDEQMKAIPRYELVRIMQFVYDKTDSGVSYFDED